MNKNIIVKKNKKENEIEIIFQNFKQNLNFKQNAIFTIDKKGIILSWNNGATNLMGYSSKEVLGKNFLKFYISKKNTPTFKLNHVKQLGENAKETNLIRKNESVFLANVLLFPIKNDNKVTGYTHVIYDVSYIKDNEIALKKCTAELKKIKKTLEIKNAKDEALLESIGEGIVATDNKGKMILINSVALTMFGLTANTSYGKLFTKVFCAYDEKGVKIPSNDLTVPDVIKTGKKVLHSRFYYGIVGKNNFPVAATSTPVILSGKRIGTITIFRNIKKEVEIDNIKSEFVSIVSHQLRTPLTAIKLLTELVLDNMYSGMSHENEETILNIQQSNEKMIHLVNSLLKMSQMETGKLKIKPTYNKIYEFIVSIADDATALAKSKNITLLLPKNQQDSMSVYIDKELFRQVFLNLILNAIEYSKKGSKIWIGCTSESDGSCIVSIKDEGIGIPKDKNEKIFDRFFRATNAVNYKPAGTGLGLYVCRLIVEKHGGQIWVTSDEKKGSTFYVSIPPKNNITHLN
ncbi:PAS domain-containing protein [Arenimonas sp.]|nr:PAS domain-containing protein [Candidatus Parcubacteria bacterium]